VESWPAPTLPRLPCEPAGPAVRLHDSATDEVRPLAPGPVVTLYVCGITPYDATHLGHALTYLTYDLLVRILRDQGHQVRYTQNVTDVDDPLLERARETGVDWQELATQQIQLFREDLTALRVLPPDDYVGAVESIGWVISLITDLQSAGATYPLGPDVYFRATASGALGGVSHLTREEMVQISRERGGDPDREGKQDPLDPLLWMGRRGEDPHWGSPWGDGRPGWHVECAAIARETLGGQIDVQGGGQDLIFPHHELGAAQAEVACGARPFARFFTHVALLSLDGHKMSKSRGNLVFVSALRAAGVDPAAIRLGLASHHYREPWEWTPQILTEAQQRLQRWRDAVSRPTGVPAEATVLAMRTALADDLDIGTAVRAVDHWCRQTTGPGGGDPAAPGLVGSAVDALLGIAL
jgi:L-cysteine:1D-myo-inositol 2-amino-2-deoxy-alpha-D-glucopyranoside ligase